MPKAWFTIIVVLQCDVVRLAACALLRAAPTSQRLVHNFGTRCATPSGDSALFITCYSFNSIRSSLLYYIYADIRSQQLKLERILPITFAVQYIGQVNWQYTRIQVLIISGFKCSSLYNCQKYIYKFWGKITLL